MFRLPSAAHHVASGDELRYRGNKGRIDHPTDHISVVARVLRRAAGGDPAQSALAGDDLARASSWMSHARRCICVHERLVLSRQTRVRDALWRGLRDYADTRTAAAIDAVHPRAVA